MAKPKSTTVATLKEFTSIVEDCLKSARDRHPDAAFKNNWYRGHGRSTTHKLAPGLYRHPTHTALAALLNMEKRMLDDFRRQSVLHEHPRVSSYLDDRFETLFYMQHYGVPTRLLDWTANPFIALYFALTAAERKPGSASFDEDAAVWVLDPVSWNSRALGDVGWEEAGPAAPDEDVLKSYYPKPRYEPIDIAQILDFPVAILGVSNNARMFAQKGVFTVFGKKTETMESVYDTAGFPLDCLQKIEIGKDKILDMLDTLISLGYTDSVSYPDLHGLALEIKRLNGFST